MRLTITKDYKAYAESDLLGYVGETNARTIEVKQPKVPQADTYRLRFDYSGGAVHDVPIRDGSILITGSLLSKAGRVKCQWLATASDGDNYKLVAKSNVFVLRVEDSISDEIIPAPTYEQAVKALDKVLTAESTAADYADKAQESANAAQTCEKAVQAAEGKVENLYSEAITAAEKAEQAADSAEEKAAYISDNAEKIQENAENISDLQASDTALESKYNSINSRISALEQSVNTMFTDSSLIALKQIVLVGVTKLSWNTSTNKWVAQYNIKNSGTNGSSSSSSQSANCQTTNNGDVYSIYDIPLVPNQMIANTLTNTHTNPRVIATLSFPRYASEVNSNTLDLMLSVSLNSQAVATLTRKNADIPHGSFDINWILLADKKN
nr:MAG: hypothetical protein [Bacteriophage sp.]